MVADRLNGVREGILERRGPGIIGKWETKWFRIEGRTLACFSVEDTGGRGILEGITSLPEARNLVLESDKCECTFVQPDGTKMRLRSQTIREAQGWFAALTNGHLVEPTEKDPEKRGDEWQNGQTPTPESPATTPRTPRVPNGLPRHPKSWALMRSRSLDLQQTPPPPGEESSSPSSPRARYRILELHSMHEAKLRRIESRRAKLEAEEMQRIAEERAALKQGTRGQLDWSLLNAGEAASRLFAHRREAEQRMLRLQHRLVEEERQRLQETRFPRKAQSLQVPPGVAGVRLYEDHRRREQERQAKKAEDSPPPPPEKSPPLKPSAAPATQYIEKLYEDAQHRRQQLERKQKEREAAEVKRLADEAHCQRSGPVNMGCIEKLHGDHEQRLKKQAMKLAQKQERERQEHEETTRWSPPPRRFACAQPQDPIWQRGRSAYFIGADTSASSSSTVRRPHLDLATRADVAIAAVTHALQLRCSDPSAEPSSSDSKVLTGPLRAVLRIYGDAQSGCERGEGYPALCVRSSQRLFRDCCLIPEFEGFEQCREPNPIHQVEERLDDLLWTAQRAQLVLQELFVSPANAASWQPGQTRTGLKNAHQALFAYNPGVKTRQAAELKARVLYQPGEGTRRFRHLLDLARLTLVFANCDLLHAGLDEVRGRFEVVRVWNRFASPTRFGERFVEVSLVLKLPSASGAIVPHVCELRLEELTFHQARHFAAPHMAEFDACVRTLYYRPNRDVDALVYLARATLAAASETHSLRSFRRLLAQNYGSPIVAWRRMGGTRLIPFDRFRELCHSLKCREYAPVFWRALDPGHGGCISLFELAPEAVALLARLRAHILALERADDPDDQELFERLTMSCSGAGTAGCLEQHEFNSVLKSFGFGQVDASRLFRHLDYQAGSLYRPLSGINIADVSWLRRLNQIVDVDAVCLAAQDTLTDHEALSQLTRLGGKSRTKKVWGVPALKRNSLYPVNEVAAAAPPLTARESRASLCSVASRRSRSLEPDDLVLDGQPRFSDPRTSGHLHQESEDLGLHGHARFSDPRINGQLSQEHHEARTSEAEGQAGGALSQAEGARLSRARTSERDLSRRSSLASVSEQARPPRQPQVRIGEAETVRASQVTRLPEVSAVRTSQAGPPGRARVSVTAPRLSSGSALATQLSAGDLSPRGSTARQSVQSQHSAAGRPTFAEANSRAGAEASEHMMEEAEYVEEVELEMEEGGIVLEPTEHAVGHTGGGDGEEDDDYNVDGEEEPHAGEEEGAEVEECY